jgi:CDP-diacylglycerol--serine O-phosphatidyltransferase
MRSPAAAFHPSNLGTCLSLTAGLGSVVAALQGSAPAAGALLAVAALCDTFDGWFARRFVRSSDQQALGAQLDSLSDAVAFGVAPVISASILVGGTGPAWLVWWMAAIGYVACALARLAFYNVSHERHGFVGMPAPAAALVWSTALAFQPGVATATLLAVALGAAMIAPLAIPRPGRVGLAVFAAWPVVLLILYGVGF